MTRSLNFGLGSGGSSVGAANVLSSTCGSCRSTLALEIKWGTVSGLQLMRMDHYDLERLTRDPSQL